MPIVTINGKMYRVEEGTSQAEIDAAAKRLGGRATVVRGGPAKPVGQMAPDEEKEVQRRISNMGKRGDRGGVREQVASGFLSNFTDELAGGTNALLLGVPRAIMRGDIREIPKEYRITREVQRRNERDYEEKHPVLSTAAKIAGALAVPAGEFGIAKASPGVLGTIGEAAAQGGAYGALGAVGEAKDLKDVPQAALTGGAVGSIYGTAGGGVTALARKGVQALRSRAPDEAKNVAYERIAQALDDAPRYRGTTGAGKDMRHTAESAAREIAVARGRGSPDYAVSDLSPELGNLSGFIRRKPGTGIQNELYDWSAGRADMRNDRFDQQIRESITPKTGQDFLGREKELKRAHGAVGDTLDSLIKDNAPLNWNDKLDDLVYSDRPTMRSAIRKAYNMAKDEGVDPEKVGFLRNADGSVDLAHMPTFRTLDYMRRSLGDKADAFRKGGQRDAARRVDALYHQLRDGLVEANPKYGEQLNAHRTIFEQERGAEFGKSVMSMVSKDPRRAAMELDELKAATPHAFEDVRTGVIDDLLNQRNKNGRDVVNTFDRMMKNPDQREVLRRVFDNDARLNRFSRWLKRQKAMGFTDQQTSGRQSITSDMGLLNQEMQTPTEELAQSAIHGYGFGGIVGLSGNVARLLSKYASTMSPHALKELGEILMSDGSTLASGITKSRAVKAARDAANRAAVRRVSRAAGFTAGTEVGK